MYELSLLIGKVRGKKNPQGYVISTLKRKTKGQKNKIDMEELKVKVVEVSQEKEQPQGNDYIRVTVEIDGRKIAVWTTESNINALRFDIDKKR